MVRLSLASLGACLLFSQISALPAAHYQSRGSQEMPQMSLVPSKDPWYTAPAGFELTSPGTILRLRVASKALQAQGNCSTAYNILFRTTDGRHQPSWAVTTLYVPNNADPSTLLSYQFPYNSPNVDFSPSYIFQQANMTDLANALGKGWFVNVPDHEGHDAADGTNTVNGFTTLDSVRAVLHAGIGLGDNPRIAMWGYSGGALASEWASELQNTYAPELEFSGMAIGGLPPNVTQLFIASNEGPYAAMIPLNLVGITKEFPSACSYLTSQLIETGQYNSSYFLSVEAMDAQTAFTAFAGQDCWKYFKNGSAVIDDQRIRDILKNNWFMGFHGVPQMPVYLYKAINDEVAPIEGVDSWQRRYCDIGVNIWYERNTLATHLDEMYAGDVRAFQWLSTILDGTWAQKYPTVGCTVQNVTISPPNGTCTGGVGPGCN